MGQMLGRAALVFTLLSSGSAFAEDRVDATSRGVRVPSHSEQTVAASHRLGRRLRSALDQSSWSSRPGGTPCRSHSASARTRGWSTCSDRTTISAWRAPHRAAAIMAVAARLNAIGEALATAPKSCAPMLERTDDGPVPAGSWRKGVSRQSESTGCPSGFENIRAKPLNPDPMVCSQRIRCGNASASVALLACHGTDCRSA